MTNAEMIDWMDQGSKVLIREDMMSAELYLCPPPKHEQYDEDLVRQILAIRGIRYGILDEQIRMILAEKRYYTKVVVAEGTHVKDGADGRFDFLFDTETKKKPRILPDGSVDYGTLSDIPTVQEGAIIARYTPATQGTEGKDLFGKVLPARNGRDLPELKGKGFCVSEDKRSYMATASGRIELENGRITIKNFLEVKEDVNLLTGDIRFDGDVLIHGSVSEGRRVEAGGTLTIEGSVEACELYAGMDIVITRGMQGGGRGRVECRGSLSGRFFEQAVLKAGKNVSANSILNCQVEAGEDIVIAGRQGVILGGTVYAGRSIEVSSVGNVAEVQSELIAGKSDELAVQLQTLKQEYQDIQKQMEKTKCVLQLLQERREKDEEKIFSQERRMQVTRLKILLDSRLNENVAKCQEILAKMELAEQAGIVIHQSAYPGTRVRINGARYVFAEVLTGVTLKKKENKICLYSN